MQDSQIKTIRQIFFSFQNTSIGIQKVLKIKQNFFFLLCSFVELFREKTSFSVKMAHYKGPASESQRVMQLQKKRERHQEEIDFKKRKLADELKVNKMEAKFSGRTKVAII